MSAENDTNLSLLSQLICKFFYMNHEWTIEEYDRRKDPAKQVLYYYTTIGSSGINSRLKDLSKGSGYCCYCCMKGFPPSKVVFNQMSPSIEGPLQSMVIFH